MKKIITLILMLTLMSACSKKSDIDLVDQQFKKELKTIEKCELTTDQFTTSSFVGITEPKEIIKMFCKPTKQIVKGIKIIEEKKISDYQIDIYIEVPKLNKNAYLRSIQEQVTKHDDYTQTIAKDQLSKLFGDVVQSTSIDELMTEKEIVKIEYKKMNDKWECVNIYSLLKALPYY